MDLVHFARMFIQNTRRLGKACSKVSIAPFERLRNAFSRFYHDLSDRYRLIVVANCCSGYIHYEEQS